MNEGRKEIVQIVFLLIGIVFLVKLFFIQVIDDRYAELADGNAILRQVEYPFRGLIYDRNGKLIVYNSPEYDLEMVVKDVKKFDSVKFCEVFEISKEELRRRFKEMRGPQRILAL
jgi:penicillin-binding protein 2